MNRRRRILLIQGHPDPAGGRFCHALADAYARGAEARGSEVERCQVAALDFPLLRTKSDFQHGDAPETLRPIQPAIERADHLVIVYPLWLGTMPALLKAFMEQVFRPGFVAESRADGWQRPSRLKGKSARVIVTMGMPAIIYRWYFRAHGLRNLERNILRFCGIRPVKDTLIGLVEVMSDAERRRWLERVEGLGVKGH